MLKSEVISIRVDPETKTQLTQICEKENRSISNIVGMAIERYLQENKLSKENTKN